MDPILAQVLGAAAYGLVAFTIGYVVGHYGLSTIETDITNIKNDILNLKLQSPISVTPIAPQAPLPTHTTSPSSPGTPLPVTVTTATVA